MSSQPRASIIKDEGGQYTQRLVAPRRSTVWGVDYVRIQRQRSIIDKSAKNIQRIKAGYVTNISLGVAGLTVIVPLILLFGGIFAYVNSAVHGYVVFVFPSLSDAGSHSYSQCVFTFTITNAVCLAMIIFASRHAQISRRIWDNDIYVKKLARASTGFSAGGFFALMVVACFQSNIATNIHNTCAVLFFVLTTIGFGYQTALTITTRNNWHVSFNLWPYRLILSIVQVISIIILFTFIIVAQLSRGLSNSSKEWVPSQPGFVLWNTAMFFEWILTFSIFIYLYTYIPDLQRLKIFVYIQEQFSVTTEPAHAPEKEVEVDFTSGVPKQTLSSKNLASDVSTGETMQPHESLQHVILGAPEAENVEETV